MLDDSYIRMLIFFAVLVLMMLAEAYWPKRMRQQARVQRWLTNLGFVLIDSLCLRLLGSVSAVVVANYTMMNGWGLLALSPIVLPIYLEVLLGIVLLDLAIYLQHVASHHIPFLWRFHKVHHVDRDIDATTGVRFHPVEAVLSMLYKCVMIFLIGPLTLAVVLFEILLNASAMFNHANVRLPARLDSVLRLLIVTPDVHRVHHSCVEQETNSNYGFFLLLWDRLFATYRAQPLKGHQGMTIGLHEHQTDKPASLIWSLRLPFIKNK